MKTARMFILLLTLCVCPALVSGQSGTHPLSFLLVDAHARSAGLSGTYTALAADANALRYNPAGLGFVPREQVTFTHNQYFQDVLQEYLAFASPKGWGMNFNYVDYGRIQRTTLSDHTGVTLGKFSATDLSFAAGYGTKVTEGFSIGVGAKYIKESLADEAGYAIAGDIGGLYSLPGFPRLKVGGSVQNIGPALKFQNEKEELPVSTRFGAAYSFGTSGNDTVVALETFKQKGERAGVSAGLEFVCTKAFHLRTGYNSINDDGLGITVGAGYGGRSLAFDYAFVPFKTLGATHRFSVTFLWGRQVISKGERFPLIMI